MHATLASAFLLASQSSVPAQPAPTPDQVAWVKARAIPLKTVEAGNGFGDLEPLKALIGDARIVALGECTHGSREVFQMKHRLLEFLASEMGFSIFSIEASTPEAYRVDDFVSRGEGNPAGLIRGMYFWTWSTEEVLDMVRWMRAFNEAGKGHVAFTGFDMQTPDVARTIVVEYLEKVDPEAGAEARKTYEEMPRAASSGFGVATGTFPLEACKGKRIRYSGWIRTENVNGWAGLWWRIDGASGPIGFDNMSDRGPRGDADWKEYSIELDVTDEALNTNFGVLMTGTGKAWFDGLAVEIDGERFQHDALFDLDFESSAIRGFFAPALDYEVVLATDAVKSGEQSLRVSKIDAADKNAQVDPAEHAQAVKKVAAELEAGRERYVAASSELDFEWAAHNAEILAQGARMNAAGSMGGYVRDKSLAENVGWILEQDPLARIVLWAHNGHVAELGGAMGLHLALAYGADYIAIGFATADGAYTAMRQGGGLGRDNPLLAPPEGSVERVFQASGLPQFLLDLRTASSDDPASAFLAEPTLFRSIGALATEQQFFPIDVQEAYDAIVWIETTSASREMPQ